MSSMAFKIWLRVNLPEEYLALRVIEWVKFAKKCCSYEFHPPLGKGGLGGFSDVTLQSPT